MSSKDSEKYPEGTGSNESTAGIKVNPISKRILASRTPHGKKDKVNNTNNTTTFDTATAKSGTLRRKGRSVQIEAEKEL